MPESVSNSDARAAPAHAELCAMSNFSFLRGASHPEELVARAAELGLSAITIADRNSLAGVVRAHVALRELKRAQAEGGTVRVRGHVRVDASSRQEIDPGGGLAAVGALPRLIVGARLVLEDSAIEWIALPTDRAAYARLSRLLSVGKLRAGKGECRLMRADLEEWGAGMVLIALPPDVLAPDEGGPEERRQRERAAPGPRGGRRSARPWGAGRARGAGGQDRGKS
jgi:error-prone DNA polymerase